jgi:sigma-B regulation protein RsbU (phosphoserine phosphatase)
MEEGIQYESRQIEIKKKSRLVIYTDGLTEADNPSGTLYGDLRLKNDLKNYKDRSAKDFFDAILKDLSGFTAKDTFEDDVTVLIIDFQGDMV